MTNPTLLPPGSSALERRLAEACADMADLDVPLRQLWDPETCPVAFLPYLAWARSVDRWDERWPELVKRHVVKDAFYVHQHKGTIAAVRRVVEPFGFLLRIIEWWQNGEAPGTFRLEIGIDDKGITEDIYIEIDRLINDAKPISRHLLGLSLSLQTQGYVALGGGCYVGDTLTIYPYFPETIAVGGHDYTGAAVHLIDTMEIESGD